MCTQSFDYYLTEFDKKFSGWDFSYISERHSYEPLSWSYKSIITEKIKFANMILDMGTGGGEFLASIAPFTSNQKIYATENYKPNLKIACEKLEPFNVSVLSYDEDKENLPFENEFFDLIINRHEFYKSQVVFSKLKHNGLFITQQVGGLDCFDMNVLFKVSQTEFSEFTLTKTVNEMKISGFKIQKQNECFPKLRFYDVGALIYYLKAIPWQIENFEPNKFLDELKFIHKIISQKGFYDFTYHRFLIIGYK